MAFGNYLRDIFLITKNLRDIFSRRSYEKPLTTARHKSVQFFFFDNRVSPTFNVGPPITIMHMWIYTTID